MEGSFAPLRPHWDPSGGQFSEITEKEHASGTPLVEKIYNAAGKQKKIPRQQITFAFFQRH